MSHLSIEERYQITDAALKHFGNKNQIIKSLEEFSEIQVQLAKHLLGQGENAHVIEEIADAAIMLNQLCNLFGFSEVDTEIDQKLTRLKGRLPKEGCFLF